ncbi:MAG: DUF4145 domain-containing protein [Vibrio sp.]
MSDIETVVMHTRRLERLLREQYYADGQGLIELTESCGTRLPSSVVKKIYSIAEIRQNFLEDDDYRLDSLDEFVQTCIDCEKELTPRGGRLVWGAVIGLISLILVGSLIFYSIHWDSVTKHLGM